MADVKVSELPIAAAVAATDHVVGNVSGTTSRVKVGVGGGLATVTARLWIPATELFAVTTPGVGNAGGGTWPNRVYAAGATVGASCAIIAPDGWTTFDAYVWWAPDDATGGNVFWRWYSIANAGTQRAPGDVLTTANTYVDVPTAAPTTANQVTRTLLASGETFSDPGNKIVRIYLVRVGADVLDTSSADARLFGVELVRNP